MPAAARRTTSRRGRRLADRLTGMRDYPYRSGHTGYFARAAVSADVRPLQRAELADEPAATDVRHRQPDPALVDPRRGLGRTGQLLDRRLVDEHQHDDL